MGEDVRNLLRRFAGAAVLMLLLLPTVSACLAEPRQPDQSTREEFARSVRAAAVSGSVERVEGLVDPVFSNTRPEAQQLVDSARGWTPGTWQLAISSDFPEIAAVTAHRTGQDATVRYTISWSDDLWKLVMGESEVRPSGAARPVGPGSDATILPAQPTQVPAACQSGAGGTVSVTGAAALACRTFTSTSGYARSQNMYWLASSPLHLGFEPMDGVLTMVVRMPCGVLNVPASADEFGLVPEPARMAESANGCVGPASDHRSWTTAYFKEPMVYRLDSSELVLTSELGQIRLKHD
ncbi:MAG TPA: hypothetical protein VF885_01120 [Arthrobacter sp.]